MGFTGKTKKLLAGKKKKKSKDASEEVSPLMVDEEQPAPVTSLKDKDKEREKKMEERTKRRDKRDRRLADNKATKEASAKDKKKSKKPKLSREEQDAKDAKLGCCHQFAQFLAKLIHVIDGLIGLTFVVYGSLIYTNFETPAMEAVITTLTYGCTMLFTSIMGVVGFYLKVCNRCGLVLSAYTAPLIAFFYIFIIIALLSSPDVYFDYLTEHKDVLYLNDAEIATLRQILPVFYIILASLTAVEICRFIVLRQIRHKLVKYDAASSRILERSLKDSMRSKGSSKKGSERSKGSSKQGSDRTKLTQPLLGDDGSDEEDSDYDV